MDDLLIEPARVRHAGPRAALEVSCPLPGVMRVRHAPLSALSSVGHPELPPKRSPAVLEPPSPRALAVQREGDALHVQGEGAALRLALGAHTWAFADARGALLARCVGVGGEAAVGYPVPHYRAWLALHAPAGEAYLGFGEKTGPLDKRGLRFTFWNTDVIPHHPDTDPLYVSIPFFLALGAEGGAWGCFVDETWRSEVDVCQAHPAEVRWQSAGPELDTYLVAGPTPAEVLARFSALVGRAPLPPLWALGAHQSRWGYESAAEVQALVRTYRAHRLPLDCVHLDIDHLEGFKSFTWDRARFPSPRALAEAAAAEGVKLVTIVDPALQVEEGYRPYEEARARGFLVREDRGGPLVGEVWPAPCVFPDLTRAEVQRWWGELHAEALAAGVRGFWCDMNEPSAFRLERPERKDLTPPVTARGLPDTQEGPTLPYTARHGERRHLEVHNVYGQGMARAAHEASRRHAPGRRPFVLTRAGYAGVQRWAAVWTGDNSSHWTHLEASIPMLLGLGLSGVPFVGADVPGFLGRASGELLARWMQLGTFYPLLRNHSARGTAPKEPWRFGEPWLALARAALERRYRLLPTLYTLMHEAHRTGLPPLRPLALHAPGERAARVADDQFLFGPDLLVAPVVRPGQTRRLAWLPAGRWLPLPSLAAAGASEEGGRHVVAEAPLEHVPLWLREGGALALTAPALHTGAASWETLEWHVHPAARIEARLYEDAGEGEGDARLTELGGGLEGGRLVLERRAHGGLPLARRTERLVLHGLPAPARVEGALSHRVGEGGVEVEVEAGWERVVLER